MPVRALIASADIFGLAQNNVRVALSRLVASGVVEATERGEYRLGPPASHLQARIASWRHVDSRLVAWDGSWIGVYAATPSRLRNASKHRQQKALEGNGFKQYRPGLFLRPDNLAGGVPAMRSALLAYGLDPSAPVFRIDQLDDRTVGNARRLWNCAAIRRGYNDNLRALKRSRARLATIPLRSAMAESFLVGGSVIRSLVLDPLLPDTLVPGVERRALVREMERYDRAGRRLWLRHLKQFNIGNRQTPTDTSRLYDRRLFSVHEEAEPRDGVALLETQPTRVLKPPACSMRRRPKPRSDRPPMQPQLQTPPRV